MGKTKSGRMRSIIRSELAFVRLATVALYLLARSSAICSGVIRFVSRLFRRRRFPSWSWSRPIQAAWCAVLMEDDGPAFSRFDRMRWELRLIGFLTFRRFRMRKYLIMAGLVALTAIGAALTMVPSSSAAREKEAEASKSATAGQLPIGN